MATRKQRRRREKEKRHEYDLVQIDEEGNEVVISSSELRPDSAGGSKRASKGASAPRASRRGVIQPPSWGRIGKRAALFAPIFLATVLLLGGDKMTFEGAVIQTFLLMAVFVPFSYFMDRLMWRSQQKRLARARDA